MTTNRFLHETNLHYADNMGSDKVYNTWMEDLGNNNYVVGFSYGRRGSTLTSGRKTTVPVNYQTALKVLNKLVAEKQAKGYQIITAGAVSRAVSSAPVNTNKRQEGDPSGHVVQLLTALYEDEIEEYLDDDNYYLQEKVDGERRLVALNSPEVGVTAISINRKGKYVALPQNLFNEFTAMSGNYYLFDGELIDDTYYAFDLLISPGSHFNTHYEDRFLRLVEAVAEFTVTPSNIKVVKSAKEFSEKHRLYEALVKQNAEGIVFKHKESLYTPGRPGKASKGPFKYKFYETASFVVHKVNQQRSVELKLFTGRQIGEHVLVGNVTIPVNFQIPPVGAVIEVRYLYAYLGGSVYQPVYLGERTDINPEECLISQLKYKRPEINLI